jgi:hypothetical protein
MTIDERIATRNAANLAADWSMRGQGRPRQVDRSAVMTYLRAVRAGVPQSHECQTASFCGAAGLVTIHGRRAVITPEGLAVLA